MEAEYVHKNVYDLEVRRLEERMDNTLSKIESRMDAYLARMDARDARMEARLDVMETKLGNMNWALNLLLTVAGIAVAGVSIYLAIHH